jgi:hypothetical protein
VADRPHLAEGDMYCITVMYPKIPGTTFDKDYYLGVHVPLAFRELERRFAVTPVRIDCLTDCRMIGGAEGGEGATDYHCIFHMYFRSREDAERMIALRNSQDDASVELRADIKAYTDAELRAVLSEATSRDVPALIARGEALVAAAR